MECRLRIVDLLDVTSRSRFPVSTGSISHELVLGRKLVRLREGDHAM